MNVISVWRPMNHYVKITLAVQILIFCIAEAFSQEDPKLSEGLKFAIAVGNQITISTDYEIIKPKQRWTYIHQEVRKRLNQGDREFENGNLSSAYRKYNEGFIGVLRIMNFQKAEEPDDPLTLVNVFTLSDQVAARIEDMKPPIIKAYDKNNTKHFSQNDYWEYTRGLNTAGIYYHAKGIYGTAEKLYLRALALRGEQFGKTSEPYVCSLSNLALLRKDQGNFKAAEEMFNYLIRFYTKAKGTSSKEYRIVANNRAMMLAQMGRKADALKEIEELDKIASVKSIDSMHLDDLRISTNHALLKNADGKNIESIARLKSILRLLESEKYENRPDYFLNAIYLGRIYLNSGMADSANSIMENSVKKVKRKYDISSPIYINSQMALIEYQLHNGNYSNALVNCNELLTTLEKQVGIRHLDYLDVSVKSAYCKWKLGFTNEALKHFTLANEQYLIMVNDLFKTLSESEQSRFWNSISGNINLFHLFVADQVHEYPELAQKSYDLHLKTKGLLINNSKKTRLTIQSSSDTGVKQKFNHWLDLKEKYYGYLGMDKDELSLQGFNIDVIKKEINELERTLVSTSKLFEAEFMKDDVNWKKVQLALQKDEAAIEIIRAHDPMTNLTQYLGLILSDTGQPVIVVFNNGHELESKLYRLYKNSIALRQGDVKSYVNYWQPVDKLLTTKKRIYLSVDGVFNNINVNTLYKSDQSPLIDDREIVYVSNTQDIINREHVKGLAIKDVYLVGNPSYGDDRLISPLPGTKEEVDMIHDLLSSANISSTTLTEGDATKDNLMKIQSPSVLHIATHGFFLNADGIKHNQLLTQPFEGPLYKSGLLLTGASVAYNDGQFDPISNGVFTAYEAMNLNMTNTEVIVLSACETGLGEIINGEGVYGLSRSLQVAGSKSIIISLWKVDDTATKELMKLFYKNWTGGNDRWQSFRMAQIELRKQYAEPYYWGAFMMIN